MFEADLTTFLNALNANRVYWDATPPGYVVTADPIIVLQIVGGNAGFYVERDSGVPPRNSRVQIEVVSNSRLVTNSLMKSIEDALQASDFVVEPRGAMLNDYMDELTAYIARQIFSFSNLLS